MLVSASVSPWFFSSFGDSVFLWGHPALGQPLLPSPWHLRSLMPPVPIASPVGGVSQLLHQISLFLSPLHLTGNLALKRILTSHSFVWFWGYCGFVSFWCWDPSCPTTILHVSSDLLGQSHYKFNAAFSMICSFLQAMVLTGSLPACD